MKADYLTLTDGRKLRVEFNWNVVCELTVLTGIDMSTFVGSNADVQLLRTIAWCCAIEGEAIEGRELELTEMEFGRLVSMEGIVAFSQILVAQSGNSGQKKSPEVKEKPRRIFFRGRK